MTIAPWRRSISRAPRQPHLGNTCTRNIASWRSKSVCETAPACRIRVVDEQIDFGSGEPRRKRRRLRLLGQIAGNDIDLNPVAGLQSVFRQTAGPHGAP